MRERADPKPLVELRPASPARNIANCDHDGLLLADENHEPLTAIAVLILKRSAPWEVLDGISWGALPLVAGLFVLVEAIDKTGLIHFGR